MVEAVDSSHDTCQTTPDDHNGREVQGRLPPDKDHVGPRFKCDVCYEEYYQSNGVFVRGQLEIIGHSSDLCISDAGDVGSIYING